MLKQEYSNYRFKNHKGRFGLEIETETPSSDEYPIGFFTLHVDDSSGKEYYTMANLPDFVGHIDPSLRNFGMEYVFATPKDYDQSCEALDKFEKVMKNVNFIQDAPATSVHVHINMLNEEILTMANFLTLYAYYENVLVEYSGSARRSNLFALPIRVAEQTADNIVKLLRSISLGEQKAIAFNANYVKYAALNLACLSSLGTLEVRTMRGITDVKTIKNWLKIFDNMMEYSRTRGMTPVDILADIRDNDIELFSNVFGEIAAELRTVVEDSGPDFRIEVLTTRNLSYVVPITRAVTDWNSINTAASRKREEVKKAATSGSSSISGANPTEFIFDMADTLNDLDGDF